MVWGSSQAGGPCLPSLSSPLSCRAPLRSGGPISPVITDLLHEKTPRSVGGHEGQRTDSGESLRAREVRRIEPRPHLSLIHISEPTRQAEISYAVFCLKKKK